MDKVNKLVQCLKKISITHLMLSNLLLLNPLLGISNCNCPDEARHYYFTQHSDTLMLKGYYKIVDCFTGVTIDSTRFDNTHNRNASKLEKFFSKNNSCWSQSEINEFRSYNWTIGKRMLYNWNGQLIKRTDTIVALYSIRKYYMNVSIGTKEFYDNGILVAKFRMNERGQMVGDQRLYFSDGRPQEFYYISVIDEDLSTRLDGPFVTFHENGRIKRFQYIHKGYTLIDKRYNRLGIRTYNYRLRDFSEIKVN
jgi:antitoxin component YwqK of YwqJK toxin-antitoxin module